jgi:AraC family transcriptional regulator
MSTGFAAVWDDDGVRVASGDVNGFTISELQFPPSYVQDPFEPELPYLALVLQGGLEKSFRFRTMHLGAACAVSMPSGASHGARFSTVETRVVIVRPRDASSSAAAGLRRLVELRGRGFSWLGWRLASELRATDAAAPLAAEGFALELLAAACRESGAERSFGRPQAWLVDAEELLRTRIGDSIGLSELAAAVGVHPTHLARAFRARYGVSVGDYGRRVRLAWATTQIATGGRPLTEIAAEAGFADQSHFTRLFKSYVGVTPGRFRQETLRAFHTE